MKYIASCSGGKDSVATLILAKQHNEPLDMVVFAEVMFDETLSGELPEHIDFVRNTLKPWVEKELKVPFLILRSDKTYIEYFHQTATRGTYQGQKHGFPLANMCAINRDCKLRPIHKLHKAIDDDIISYIGIAADEPQRLARLKAD